MAESLTKLTIAGQKDELERGSYREKQRRSHAFKIICGPGKLGRILSEMATEPTQATLCALQMPK